MNYYNAYICKRGHVVSIWKEIDNSYCQICGTEIYSKCPNCGAPFRGDDKDQIIHNVKSYKRPLCCYNCGKPLPWTQETLDNAVDALSLDQDLDNETKELIRSAIPDLIMETPAGTPLSIGKYKKYVPKLNDLARNVLENVLTSFISDAVRTKLFL